MFAYLTREKKYGQSTHNELACNYPNLLSQTDWIGADLWRTIFTRTREFGWSTHVDTTPARVRVWDMSQTWWKVIGHLSQNPLSKTNPSQRRRRKMRRKSKHCARERIVSEANQETGTWSSSLMVFNRVFRPELEEQPSIEKARNTLVPFHRSQWRERVV